MSTTIQPVLETLTRLSDCSTLLREAGFDVKVSEDSIFGTIKHEDFSKYVGKNHFTPYFRDFFLGTTASGAWYATSSIHGDMRHYRCRTVWKDNSILNIFAHDKDPLEAVKKFLILWQNKTYNLPHQIVK